MVQDPKKQDEPTAQREANKKPADKAGFVVI
jgi:hypothetical protein